MKRIIVAGGSGFLGRSLTPLLVSKGYKIIVLGRGPSREKAGVDFVQWNGATIGRWSELLDGAKAVVNLTGKSVNCRYTPANRREIIDSRVNSVRVLGEAIAKCVHAPEAFVQASSLAIYGDAGDRWCDESTPQGEGFGADVCRLWENALDKIRAPGMRRSVHRIGFALGPNGGILEFLARLTLWFLGGQVGHGQQFISWIHVEDLNRMLLLAIERDDIEGVFNATAPNPVTNAVFMRELRSALHRPWSPPVPAPMAHLGAWVMGTEASLALTGRRCAPKRFLEKGFKFDFPDLRDALRNIYC
ncbi:MAG: TIGR01777 family oxidoreductase [Chthoniobacterales bacterium]